MSTTARTAAGGSFPPITSIVASVPADNIDTDQIIPARFLKITDSAGLGEHAFEDFRRNPDGSPRPDFALNRPDRAGAAILIAGDNFGCGSSREHAPWALKGAGIRAVVSTSFADIFRGNALKNGLLPVALNTADRDALHALGNGDAKVTVDLEAQTITWPGGSASFRIDPFARTCLLQGVDELGYILGHEPAISAFEKARSTAGGKA
jgi:3-isopropylmalate/(R)-2-methylmalate dehydratase small subunit